MNCKKDDMARVVDGGVEPDTFGARILQSLLNKIVMCVAHEAVPSGDMMWRIDPALPTGLPEGGYVTHIADVNLRPLPPLADEGHIGEIRQRELADH